MKVRIKKANKRIAELIDLGYRIARELDTRQIIEIADGELTLGADDFLGSRIADEIGCFPGSGPIDVEPGKDRTEHFSEKFGYSFVWYMTDPDMICERIKEKVTLMVLELVPA